MIEKTGKINCYCCYYNNETNKIMIDLNISFDEGLGIDCGFELKPHFFKTLCYKLDDLKNKKVVVQIENNYVKEIRRQKMEIKTKFNIKQKVYVLLKESTMEIYYIQKFTIFEIVVKENKIYYGFENGYYRLLDEQDCFATREEAQAECNRRNKEK